MYAIYYKNQELYTDEPFTSWLYCGSTGDGYCNIDRITSISPFFKKRSHAESFIKKIDPDNEQSNTLEIRPVTITESENKD